MQSIFLLELLLLFVPTADSNQGCCRCEARKSRSPAVQIQARPAIGMDFFKRHKVREMAQHAWLRTREDNNTLSMVSSLSTLSLMGLHREFEEALKLIQANNLTIYNPIFNPASWASYTVGGLLSAYALTRQPLLQRHALIAAQHDTSGDLGIPQLMGGYMLETHYLRMYTAADNRSVYAEASQRIRRWLHKVGKILQFVDDEWDQSEAQWRTFDLEVQNRIHDDLLRVYVATRGEDAEIAGLLDDYVGAALSSIQITDSGRYYTRSGSDGLMSSGACSLGGFLALLSRIRHPNSVGSPSLLEMAEGLTQTCRDASILNDHLEPASFHVHPHTGQINVTLTKHALGQASVESYFVLWRITHNEKYRRWGWDVVLGLERSRRQRDKGYVAATDWQPVFFIAATLKYLYLLFSDDDEFSLDKWIFSRTGQFFPLPD